LLVDDVLDVDDVLREADAEAGSATAMTTAAAALAAPAPAVATASLVFPRRRDRCAEVRLSVADSRSGVMIALRFHGDEIVGDITESRRAGSEPDARSFSGPSESPRRANGQQKLRRSRPPAATTAATRYLRRRWH
jgi:hypothetical protein